MLLKGKAMRVKIIVFALTILISINICTATEYFVDAKKGSNENSGKSWEEAFQTITHALSIIATIPDEDSIIINIGEGRYDVALGEEFPFSITDDLSQDIEFIGTDPETTIIDASDSDFSQFYIRGDISIYTLYTAIKNVTLTGGKGLSPIPFGGGKSGGAIFVMNSVLEINNCIIKENESWFGGAIHPLGNSIINIDNTDFIGNTAFLGGVIYAVGIPRIEIRNSRFIENYSTEGGHSGLIGGGAIACEGTALDVIECDFIGNESVSYGGAISTGYNSESVYIHNSNFVENKSLHLGGAIFLDKKSGGAIYNCNFERNESGYGAGLYCRDNSSLDVVNCNFVGHSAMDWGGGIGLYSTSATIRNCLFEANRVGGYYSSGAPGGGGIAAINSSTIIESCIFKENYCEEFDQWFVNGGAGIFFESSTGTIENCEFYSNESVDVGGGISLIQSTPYINNCLLVDNIAEKGGAISSSENYTLLKINNSSFIRNSSACYQDVYGPRTEIIITNSIFWDNGNENEIINFMNDVINIYSSILMH